jgi:hypothetical protein
MSLTSDLDSRTALGMVPVVYGLFGALFSDGLFESGAGKNQLGVSSTLLGRMVRVLAILYLCSNGLLSWTSLQLYHSYVRLCVYYPNALISALFFPSLFLLPVFPDEFML